MCTLTYIPTKEGYIFTHNRDERSTRPTSKVFKTKKLGDRTIFYPEDLEAHGSWIAFSNDNTAACLLNGGAKTYTRKLPYRKSRGLVVLESFDFKNPNEFYKEYNFENIEPFTLLIRSGDGLFQITHDEDETSLKQHDPQQTNIWSSTTLYTKEVRQKREKWFEEWLAQKPELNPVNIQTFHNSAGEGDSENDLIMSRWGILQTLSITQIATTKSSALLTYRDFIQQSLDQQKLELK